MRKLSSPWLTPKMLAERIGKSVRTVERRTEDGTFRAHLIPTTEIQRYHVDEVDDAIRRNRFRRSKTGRVQ